METAKVPFVTSQLQGHDGPVIAATALTEKGSTFTGATVELIGCDVSVQAKNEGGEQYGALTMKDASLTTRGV